MATIHGAASLDLRATFAATGKVTARSSAALDLLIGFEANGSAFSLIPVTSTTLTLTQHSSVVTGYMLASAAAGDAWAEIDLGADQNEVWVTFDLFFEADALALWEAGGETILQFWNAAHDVAIDQLSIDAAGWDGLYAFGDVPAPTAGVRQVLEYRHVAGGAVEFYADGALVFSGADSEGEPTRFVTTGQVFGTTDPASVSQTRDFKIGTSRGGSDLFADDFSSGNLDLWTTVTGDVTVVTSVPVFTLTAAAATSLSLASPSAASLSLAPVTPQTLTLAAA